MNIETRQVAGSVATAVQTEPPTSPVALQTVGTEPVALQTVDAEPVALQTAPDSVTNGASQHVRGAEQQGELAPLVA